MMTSEERRTKSLECACRVYHTDVKYPTPDKLHREIIALAREFENYLNGEMPQPTEKDEPN